MGVVKVVSGFINIPYHPRGPEDYKVLGDELFKGIEPYESLVFDDTLQTPQGTWLANMLKGVSNVSHSIADNPAKNTLDYHCVQHQKFMWLQTAASLDKENPAGVYVWIDYGILHVFGVTVAVIKKFLDRVDSFGTIVLPGCWSKSRDINSSFPCWRFCGGIMVVPRVLVVPFTRLAMGITMRQISETKNVEWEVNTLARVELLDQLPISWYQADHNASMFENLP